MILPTPVQDIVKELWRRNKHLSEVKPDGTRSSDEQRRSLMKMIAEQTVFSMGAEYGMKSVGVGSTPSKDTLARLRSAGTMQMDAWDLFNGTTLEPNEAPDSFLLTDQIFVPVPPINHLAGGDNGGGTPPPVDLFQLVQNLTQRVDSQQKEITALRKDLIDFKDFCLNTFVQHTEVDHIAVEAVLSKLEVDGSTSRTLAHSHKLTLPLRRR